MARALALSTIIWPGPRPKRGGGAYLQYGAGAENDAGDDDALALGEHGAEDGALNVGARSF